MSSSGVQKERRDVPSWREISPVRNVFSGESRSSTNTLRLRSARNRFLKCWRTHIRADALAIRQGACKVVVVVAVFDFKGVEERERFPRGGLNEHRHTSFNFFCGQREPLSARIVFNGDKATLGRLR